MPKERLAAFSDGVIAIIITIMVLELKVPHGAEWAALSDVTWVFLSSIPIHIYLALRADVLERTGTISSIVSGGRFVRSDVKYVDE